MPLSFLLVLKNIKYKSLFRQSIIVIIMIEVLQAFTHTGTFDIDDIILNYIGTIVFTTSIMRLFLIKKIKKVFYTDYQIKNNFKYILFYLVLFLLLAFILIIFFR